MADIDLMDLAQEKLDDGTVDETLEKIGVKDAGKWTGLIKGALSIFTALRGFMGKKRKAEEEEEEEAEEGEESDD
jgi:hypothetical protein